MLHETWVRSIDKINHTQGRVLNNYSIFLREGGSSAILYYDRKKKIIGFLNRVLL